MTECHNDTMQDQLPLLVRGLLPANEAMLVKAHVAGCASCATEIEVLERSARLFDQATPRVDMAAIIAKLPAAPGSRPALTVSRGGSRPFAMRRYALAAAASFLLVASLSLGALRESFFGGTPATDIAVDSGVPVAAALPVGLVGGNELGDLGVDDLETLLEELDQLEATVAAEPVTMQRPVSDAPEGL
jgi:anti-sigma factor RsiW